MTYKRWFILSNGRFKSIREATTLKEAFEKSLQKWQFIINGYIPDGQVDTCGLCDLYYYKNHCIECPVALKSDAVDCANTPFERWVRDGNSIQDARAEFKFLKRLQVKMFGKK